MDIGKFGWLLVALVAYSGGFVIGAPGYGSDGGSYLDAPMPSLSKPLASEGVEAKESAPQAEAVRDDAMSQQQLKKAFGKHMKSKSMGISKTLRSSSNNNQVALATEFISVLISSYIVLNSYTYFGLPILFFVFLWNHIASYERIFQVLGYILNVVYLKF